MFKRKLNNKGIKHKNSEYNYNYSPMGLVRRHSKAKYVFKHFVARRVYNYQGK